MGRNPETPLTNKIRTVLKMAGWETWKISDSFTRGYPDLYCFKNGMSLWLEIKVPGKKPNSQQRQKIKHLSEHGIPARWTDSVAGAMKIIKEVENSADRKHNCICDPDPKGEL